VKTRLTCEDVVNRAGKPWIVNRDTQPVRYWIARALLESLWNYQITLLISLAVLAAAMSLKWVLR